MVKVDLVSYDEFEGPQENLSESGVFTAVRKLKVAYADRYKLISTLWKTSYPYNTDTLATMRSAGAEPFIAKQLQGDFQEDAAGVIDVYGPLASFEFAVVTVNYSNKSGDTSSDESNIDPQKDPLKPDAIDKGNLFIEEITPRAEFATTPGVDMFTAKASVPSASGIPANVDQIVRVGRKDFSVLRLSFTYIITYFKVFPFPIFVLDLAGTINKDPFQTKSFGKVFDPETLLYQPSAITVDAKGFFTCPLRFEYQASPVFNKNGVFVKNGGWNRVWQPTSQKYDFNYRVVDGEVVQYLPYTPVVWQDLGFLEDWQLEADKKFPGEWPPKPAPEIGFPLKPWA